MRFVIKNFRKYFGLKGISELFEQMGKARGFD